MTSPIRLTVLPSPPQGVGGARLTERELQILGLIAGGRSNEGIARELVISRRTVDAHVRAIFLKLGLAYHPLHNQRVHAALLLWSAQTHQPVPAAA